ncbi:MAG: TetR/AcrR family transcriptional regulator [Polyangiales bacterium]|nr:TetR/AcrR family transcriptional regulator [Sandaracinaceae bacterium]
MGPKATPSRRRGRPARDDVRAEVLAAAEELLRNTGLEPITVADLLEAAGVSRTTFYKHFDGRDDVIAELYIDHVNSARMEVVKAIIGSTTVLELLTRATAAYLLVMRSRGPLTVEFAKLRYSNDKMRAARDGVVDGYRMAVNGVQRIHGRPEYPRYVVEAFVSGIESLGHSVSQRSDIPPTEEGMALVMNELRSSALTLISG